MKTTPKIPLLLLASLLALLLAACATPTPAPTGAPTTANAPEPTAPVAPSATLAVIDEPGTPTAPADPALPPAVTLDVTGIAQAYTLEIVPAVPETGGPWWEAMPEYTRLTMQGYPVAKHVRQAQVFVYPVAGLAVNQAAAKAVADLQALLDSRQVGETLPALPLINEAQAFHAQVQFLDFANLSGVRYLTTYGQAAVPISNRALFYTFQGLTNDGKYYIAVVLPANSPELPADEALPAEQRADFVEKYPAYRAETVALLDAQSAAAFTPDLSLLDALVESIAIQ